MAAAHANRSPSPITSTSRPINPSLRNSDNNSAVRRSFSAKPSVLTNPKRFDPNTPANSPSDFARRHCVDSYPKEKENCEKDQNVKASKFQPSVKGSKHFMSPTISAASKFSPSPKKKVLAERNDPVRISASLSDGKVMFYSTSSPSVSFELESETEMGYEEGQRTESSLNFNESDLANKQAVLEGGTRVSKPLKKVSFSDVSLDSCSESLSESVITESDSSKMESSLKHELPFLWDSSSIAPLDADPSLPPYDPKINYLSPRPQFLHYKPNPRVEVLLSKEKGLEAVELKQLEDTLLAEILSESFSDSDGTEDTQSDNPQKEKPSVLVSEDLVVGVQEGTQDSLHYSVPSESSLPISTAFPNAVPVENAVKEKEKKPQSFSRFMGFSMILMFLIACGSVFLFHSPAFDEIPLTKMRLADVSKLQDQSRLAAASARMRFDQLARHVNQFSVDYLSSIYNLVSVLGKQRDIGSLKFMNLSSGLENDGWNRVLLNKEVSKEEILENLEEDGEFEDSVDFDEEFNIEETEEVLDDSEGDELEDIVNAEMSLLSEEEDESYSEVDYSDGNLEEEVGTCDDVLEAENVSPDCVDSAELESEESENIKRPNIADTEMDRLGVSSQAQDSALLQAVPSETIDTEKPSDANSLTKGVQTSGPTELHLSEDNFRVHLGLSALIASVLAAAAAYAYHHRRNSKIPNVVVHENPLKQCKQTGSEDRNTHSQNWQQTDSSCPSETSSFQKTAASYCVKEMREVASEAQSTERKARKYYSKREPLTAAVSSSEQNTTGAPSSYGSFTTFERIPIKSNANADEEVITPVRRSSRIRNHHQVTSP